MAVSSAQSGQSAIRSSHRPTNPPQKNTQNQEQIGTTVT